MFTSEKELLSVLKNNNHSQVQYIIALDEVGRGCVAGPVLTCATLWMKLKTAEGEGDSWATYVKDSKKLSPQKRLSCFNQVLTHFNFTRENIPYKNSTHFPLQRIMQPKQTQFFIPSHHTTSSHKISSRENDFKCLGFCLGEGSLEEVEQYNIWNAVQIGAGRALLGLKELVLEPLNISNSQIVLLMDGNKFLSVPSIFTDIVQVAVTKGDDLFLSVGLSSILAKVHRDLFMESQEEVYPQFGFGKHKGYGTAFHLDKIQKFGICSLHRQSFLKKYINPVVL